MWLPMYVQNTYMYWACRPRINICKFIRSFYMFKNYIIPGNRTVWGFERTFWKTYVCRCHLRHILISEKLNDFELSPTPQFFQNFHLNKLHQKTKCTYMYMYYVWSINNWKEKQKAYFYNKFNASDHEITFWYST